jgi:hypothetical protein
MKLSLNCVNEGGILGELVDPAPKNITQVMKADETLDYI